MRFAGSRGAQTAPGCKLARATVRHKVNRFGKTPRRSGISHNSPMDCPHCGTPCTCSVPSVAARVFPSRGFLTTAKAVDIPCCPQSSVDAGPRMHSGEPPDPRSAGDPGRQTLAEESWRAEVALRVTSYRARRERNSGEENSPAFDFRCRRFTRLRQPGSANLASRRRRLRRALSRRRPGR